VTISLNEERPGNWNLRIGGKLIYPHYKSPEEAAFKASRRDFGDEQLEQDYIGLRVPPNLTEWTICDLPE
jgi:hypothetical protein